MNTVNNHNQSSETSPSKPKLKFTRRAAPPGPDATPTPITLVPEGGKEGSPREGSPLIKVTNREFLGAIFRDLQPDEHSLALSLAGDPGGKRSWFGFDAQEVAARCPTDTNNYFNCATFGPTDAGELRALETQAVRYHCLVLDDIGTKTGLDAFPDASAIRLRAFLVAGSTTPANGILLQRKPIACVWRSRRRSTRSSSTLCGCCC